MEFVWRHTFLGLALLLMAGIAAAQQKGSDRSGGLVAVAVGLAVTPALRLLVAALFPAFTQRAHRAVVREFWPCAGWGALCAVLAVVVGSLFSAAGGAGQIVAAACGVTALALAVGGAVGMDKYLGDWALRRWGMATMGPLSVLVGAVIWTFGCAVPFVGSAAGVLTLLASLGAAVQVLLQPHAFGEGSTVGPPDPAPSEARALEKLSVIVPVYNEQSTVHEVIERVKALPLPKEIIVVDDGSTDGTPEVLRAEKDQVVRVYTSPTNFGKGAAIRIGLTFVQGDVVIIQDADLELDPEEYPRLLEPILAGRTNVVYGSRFLRHSRTPKPSGPSSLATPSPISWKTRLANRLLASWCNLLYRSRLTDVSTAYKVFRTEVIRRLQLRSIGFEFCAEVTAKLLRSGERIVEVPVGYHPRSPAEGKKLSYLRDGLKAAWWLLWLRFA